jgi:ribosomal subunit interface protein
MVAHIDVRSSFDYSNALSRHIERRVAAALRSHEANIENVALRLFDANGPRRGANDKVVRISVQVKPWGRLISSAASRDIYLSVDRAAARLKRAIRRHSSRLKSRRTRAENEGPAGRCGLR